MRAHCHRPRAQEVCSHLFKDLGPLEPASLGKLSQGVKIVLATRISREHLSGIVRWPFISVKQPLADLFGSVKDLVCRCQPMRATFEYSRMILTGSIVDL